MGRARQQVPDSTVIYDTRRLRRIFGRNGGAGGAGGSAG